MPFFGKVLFQAGGFFLKEFSFGNTAGEEAEAFGFSFNKSGISGCQRIYHF